MPEYIRWTRADSLACVAGHNTYLTVMVPPLPVGSMIRAQATITIGGADFVQMAVSTDPLVVPPIVGTQLAFPSVNGAGLQSMLVWVTGRTTSVGQFTSAANDTTASATGLDWAKSNRIAIFGFEATALVILAAYIEVFIPRVLR